MIPGMNPRQMQGMMRKMGIKQVDVPAVEVVIKCNDKEIVISNPQVLKVNMMGQETFQISGEVNEREKIKELEISSEDIDMVVQQTNCSVEEAKSAIKKTGDLAEAIIELSKGE